MEQDSPAARQPRRSLTKTQLQTALGAELLSLCQTITKDGQLTAQEVADLRAWLDDRESEELPALAHLRGTLARVMEDGRITPDEYLELYKAVETVLPPEARREAVAARQAVQRRNRPIQSANFMVAGVRYEGRPDVIRREVSEGLNVSLMRDADNAFSPNAVAVVTPPGSQIGFVPEDYAVQLAPLLDGGAKYRAKVTKILGLGRVPIPVVQAYLYDADATIPSESSENAPRKLAAQPRATEGDAAYQRERSLGLKRGLFRLAAIIVAVAVAIYFVIT